MADRDEELRAEGRRDAEIKGLVERLRDVEENLKERIRALEGNQRWFVVTILGLVLMGVSQLLQRLGGGAP